MYLTVKLLLSLSSSANQKVSNILVSKNYNNVHSSRELAKGIEYGVLCAGALRSAIRDTALQQRLGLRYNNVSLRHTSGT